MQSQKQFCKLAIAAFILLSSALTHAQAAWNFPDFSATQVFPSRKADFAMKVYYYGTSVRVERSAALSTLYMPSSSKVYNLTTYPDHSHQCVAMKPDQAKMLPSPLELLQGSNLKHTLIGTEVMEGHPTRVENVIVTRPDGRTVQSKVWEAEDLHGIPVRIESHVGEVTLIAIYRDISIAAPDAALFAVPDKCTAFDKMGQVAERTTLK
jgi:hypothetical protein